MLFTDGDQLCEAMFSDLRAAESAVWMECYIFADDDAGALFLTALTEAAAADRATEC